MSFETLAVAPLAVNGYLWDTMKLVDKSLPTVYGNLIPFFPVGDSVAGQTLWENKPYFVYDRVFRFSGNPFHPIKRESILYDLKAKEVDSLQWASALQLILDREDDAAKDINNWIRNHDTPEDFPIFFHSVRVYQSRSSAGSVNESSTSPYYITSFIIDAHYHLTKSLEDYLADTSL